MIVSTGMAAKDEIAEAVDTVRRNGGGGLALLKCTSAYPAEPRDMHLASIPALRERFGFEVGLSDHTRGSTVAVAAVASAHASSRSISRSTGAGGPDAAFSAEPSEFAELVARVREAEAAMGASAGAHRISRASGRT